MLGMDHQGLKVYKVHLNDDPGLTLTYFMVRLNLVKIVIVLIMPGFKVSVMRYCYLLSYAKKFKGLLL